MALQKGPEFWQPLLVKILAKRDQHSLSQKKAHKKLVKKASKILGLGPGNEEVNKSADTFLVQARNSGELLFSSGSISLPHSGSQRQQSSSQPQEQPSRPAPKEAEEQPPVANRGGAAGPSAAQPAEQPHQKKRKHKGADNPSLAGKADEQHGTATDAPSRSKKKKSLKGPAVDAGEPAQISAQLGEVPKEDRNEQLPAAGDRQEEAAVDGQAFGTDEQKKKKKKRKGDDSEFEGVAEFTAGQQGVTPAAANHTAKKRKKVKEAAAEQAAPAQETPAAAAAAQGSAAAPTQKGAPVAAKKKAEELADGARTWRSENKRTDVKHGRFSAAERETIKQAVKEYAEENGLSQTDLGWLYTTRKKSTANERKVTEGAWLAIAAALPHRKAKAVWACGTRMLHLGNFKGKWTAEEEASLKELLAARGERWVELGALLGRLPEAVRDKCRALKLGEAKRQGGWSAEEEGKLTTLVTRYLEERPADRPEDGRVVLDDLPWDVISRLHGSRDQDQCRRKWFQQLSPSMVDRGDWGVGDDRRLLKALFRSGAANEWEVDWGELVPGRSAAVTRRRWRLMLKCIPDGPEKGFGECVDFLVEKYTPDLKKKAAAKENAAGDGVAAPAGAA